MPTRVVDDCAEVDSVRTAYLEPVPERESPAVGAEWLRLLWERRMLLWRVTSLGLILSTLVAFLIPKRYESTARLMPPETQAMSGLATVAAMAGRSFGLGSLADNFVGIKSSGALFTDVLQSRSVQDRMIERFDLRKVYSDKYWQDARKDLAQSTAVSEDRKSGVLTITVNDRDPKRAAQMAQAYVEELDHIVTQVATSSARRERIFIEERLKSVKQDLDSASQQFSEYASQNTAVDISAQAKATVEAAARLDGELIAAQSELQGMEQIYTDNNVRVRSLRARVAELKRQLERIGGQGPEPSGGDPPQPQPDFPSIRKLPLLGLKWTDLYRQTKIQETAYELLTQQYELAKIQEAREIPTVKVLDAAVVPEKKVSPHRLPLMILGTLLAFSVGVVWVLGRETWEQMDPEDSTKQLGQEIFTHFRAIWSRWKAKWPPSSTVLRRNQQGDSE